MKKRFALGLFSGMLMGLIVTVVIGIIMLPTIVDYVWFKNLGLSSPDIAERRIDTDTSRLYQMDLVASNGDTTNLSKFKDKLIFINFWATWCRPCIAEMPSIEKLQNELAGNPKVAIVLVSSEDLTIVKRFIDRTKFPLPFYTSKDRNTVFDRRVLPVTYIIHDNKIIYKHTGSADWSSSEVVDFIAERTK